MLRRSGFEVVLGHEGPLGCWASMVGAGVGRLLFFFLGWLGSENLLPEKLRGSSKVAGSALGA